MLWFAGVGVLLVLAFSCFLSSFAILIASRSPAAYLGFRDKGLLDSHRKLATKKQGANTSSQAKLGAFVAAAFAFALNEPYLTRLVSVAFLG